jgi:NAD-dependent dihydropyrimidine dehydrogenase PreA subunit
MTDGYDCVPEASWIPSERLKFVNRFIVERKDTCISCGLCESLCPYGVHKRVEGHTKVLPPYNQKCVGPSCQSN